MWLNLLALVMLILVTFFQSLQGLFIGMVLFVMSVVCAVLAFGFYEDLYTQFLASRMPEHGEAVALMAIFIIAMIASRLFVDLVIRETIVFPRRIDRIGGAVFGFLAGLILVGVAMTGIQMLPFGHKILGFSRYRSVNGRLVRGGLLLGVDSFAVSLSELILDGSMSAKPHGEGKFREVHPDLLAEIDLKRTAGPYPQRQSVPEGSISVTHVWEPPRIVAADGKTQVTPQAGRKFLGVRLSVSGEALKGNFAPAQVRLVGQWGAKWEWFAPRGAGDGSAEPTVVDPLAVYSVPVTLDCVFEVPMNFRPRFVEFKRWCRAEITKTMLDNPSMPAYVPPTPTVKPKAEKKPPRRRRKAIKTPKGRVHGAEVAENPRFDDKLPVVLPRNELINQNADIAGNRFRSGHVVVDLSQHKIVPAMLGVSRLAVPPGKRLLQLPLREVFAYSLAGRAIAFTLKTLRQQWRVVDSTGHMYFPIGALAIANVGGHRVLELQYWPDAPMPERALKPFRRIRDSDFQQPDSKLYYLFLVRPGARIVKFTTGRAETDLSHLNLVAPR